MLNTKLTGNAICHLHFFLTEQQPTHQLHKASLFFLKFCIQPQLNEHADTQAYGVHTYVPTYQQQLQGKLADLQEINLMESAHAQKFYYDPSLRSQGLHLAFSPSAGKLGPRWEGS